MKLSSIERALEAMESMQRGMPYGLTAADTKRKLVNKLARLARGLGITPLIIGGMAVNHHGYVHYTDDVDILLSESDASLLAPRLKQKPWRRRIDVFIAGRRTSPDWNEVLPEPSELKRTRVYPLPVPALSELVALKAMSGRARDDADIAEVLKRRPRRINALHKSARVRLRTDEAKRHLDAVIARTREEIVERR